MDGKSLDIKEANIAKLKDLFPEVISEGKIDWEKLKATLGENITFDNERYVLNWAGKSEAFRVLQEPTTATLIPSKGESVDFDNTEHIFIEGENLEVLKVLQKSYFSKIKMIYIDPPYNTGNDSFVYPDRYAEKKDDYLKRVGDKDEQGYMTREGLFRKNSKESGHYHSNWLNMMYPRLFLARNLLRDDGVIFISIDDNEVHNLRLIMNEIFGEENFVSELVWQKKTGASDAKYIANITESLLVYCKNVSAGIVFKKNTESFDIKRYNLKDRHFDKRGPYYIDNLDRGGLSYSDSLNYGIECPDGSLSFPNGRTKKHKEGWIWKWSKEKLKWAIENDFIEFRKSKVKDSGWSVCYKNYLLVDNEGNSIERSAPIKNLIQGVLNADSAADIKKIFNSILFKYSKPVQLMALILNFIEFRENDVVLDFFSGTGTTAQAVLELNKADERNRKFLCVQMPEKTEEDSEAYKAGYKSIADIAKERIRRVISKVKSEQDDYRDLISEMEDKKPLDLGVKVFKLQPSNFKIWRGARFENDEKLIEQLDAFTDPVKQEAKEENILYELLLKSGFDLNSKIEQTDNLFIINDGEMIIALNKIDDSIISKIISLEPAKCLALDRLFHNNDQLKTNTVLQMKDAKIEFKTF